MGCKHCNAMAIYRCSICGKLLCGEHTKLRTVCSACIKKTASKYTMAKVMTTRERETIREFVQRFWGEEEQLTFNEKFIVSKLPAFVAKAESRIVGFISFAEIKNAIIVVALGVLPEYQSSGVGRSLIEKVEDEAKRTRKNRLLVSTSNDDLPALAFYQTLGFQLFEVKPNVIAEKHGKIVEGIGGLPVRDELRLQKILC